jgi:Ca2+-binding RTX toxin-like protein
MSARRTPIGRVALVVGLSLVVLAITAPSAFADALVDRQNVTIVYDGSGSDETMTVSAGANTITFTANIDIDVSAEDKDPGECTGDDTTAVTCDATGFTDLLISGGPRPTAANPIPVSGQDTLTIGGSVPASFDVKLFGDGNDDVLTGGLGDDQIGGGDGTDTINGGDGDDLLDGGGLPGTADLDDGDPDTLNGGEHDDTMRDSIGPDGFNGGAGTDEVDYSSTPGTAGISADIDGGVGDDGPSCPGASCDGDTIGADVEDLTGNDGDDFLGGSSDGTTPNTLDGRQGDDNLRGGSFPGLDGPDEFHGGTGTGDVVTYQLRSADIDADIGGGADGAACPGAGCEGDDVNADVEQLIGGTGDDDLTGDADANRLTGQLGDDDLQGDSSTATGADAADIFIGSGSGSAGGQNGNTGDTVSYAVRTAAVAVTIGDGPNDGSGGCPAGAGCEGDDVRADVENLVGGAGNDTLIGDSDANRFAAGGGDDVMRGGQVTGADGADNFDGGAQGPAGDTVSFENRSDGVQAIIGFGTIGEDDAIAANIDNLIGSSGPDTLAGDPDANRLEGRGADDALIGDFANTAPDAADSFLGGADGVDGDTVTYAPRDDDVNASIGGTGGSEGDAIDAGVENLTGGDGDDTLTGDNDTNRLDGANGDDVLAGSQASGADGADVLVGGAEGTPGGQHGTLGDLATYFNRADGITANLTTGAGGAAGEGDAIDATVERLTGGSGSDVLTGDAGNNRIEGGGGDDFIAGGATSTNDGIDVFVGGVNGAAGDTASYASRTDPLVIDIGGGANDGAGGCPAGGGCEDDDVQATIENLVGGSGPDTLIGSAAANVLVGGFGSDIINTLGGADRVEARDGVVDTIDCGGDSDTAVTDSNPPETATQCETVNSGDFNPSPPPPPSSDPSPGNPAPPAGDASAPNTQITAGPKPKTKKKTASFSFTSTEPGSSFQCSLDDAPFEQCTSPDDVKVKKGKHTFEVRATDAAGNTDATPASESWKVKKKGKK